MPWHGDEETLRSVCDEIDKDMYRYELSQYIDYYPTLEIYTDGTGGRFCDRLCVLQKSLLQVTKKRFPGYQALYICTNDQGGLYIKVRTAKK